jgi:hypothetical protein
VKNVNFDYEVHKGKIKRRRVFLYRAGYIISFLFLAGYWLVSILKFFNNEMFIHANYWGQPIDTFGFMIVLFFLTIAWVWSIPKYWNGPKPSND